MRLSEFALKEYDWSKLFRREADPEQEKAQKSNLTYQYYVQDFVDKGLNTLYAAISSGQVDPTIDSSKPDRVRAHLIKAANAQANKQKSQTNLNTYVKQQSSAIQTEKDPTKKYELSKELVNRLADFGNQPEWTNAVGAAKAVIKKSGLPASGVRLLLDKLSNKQTIAEDIVNEQGAMSVSEYLKGWFDLAVRRQRYDNQIADGVIRNIEQIVIQNKGKVTSALTEPFRQLANLAYTIYQTPQSKAKKTPAKAEPSEKFRWGGEVYTKTNKGWIDSKGKPADYNTTSILDQAAAQAAK